MKKGGIGTALMLPMMVAAHEFFKVWNINFRGGTLTPEVIPLDVLWVDKSNVLIVKPEGGYITKE